MALAVGSLAELLQDPLVGVPKGQLWGRMGHRAVAAPAWLCGVVSAEDEDKEKAQRPGLAAAPAQGCPTGEPQWNAEPDGHNGHPDREEVVLHLSSSAAASRAHSSAMASGSSPASNRESAHRYLATVLSSRSRITLSSPCWAAVQSWWLFV
jgi:hypothetical protein